MAAFTITVRNTIGLVGGKPAQFWGPTMTWGTSTWGNGANLKLKEVIKVLTNTLTLSDPTFVFSVAKIIQETVTPSDFQSKEVGRSIFESLDIDAGPTIENLRDQNGYSYIFPKPTTNAELRVITPYSSLSAASPSFTSQARTSTIWS